ncbi:MAG: CPBP family intramembrane metalloprotease [Chitinophagaceae bacterium]|nr:MAG: CPBP family intramembrane metalloprotease [Chitinophagaceae bacterium]
MKSLFAALRSWWQAVSPLTFLLTALFAALLVFLNYHCRLEPMIAALPVVLRLLAWYAVFALSFWTPYLFHRLTGARHTNRSGTFRLLLLLAPAIFAVKIAWPLPFSGLPSYWQTIFYYPFKLALTTLLLYIIWRRFHSDRPFYGTSRSAFGLTPYVGMLLFMLPLIAMASTQKDFLGMYPKWQHIEAVRTSGGWKQALYELSYGSDFVTIELFFRGFLVLAFARYVGPAAILPMAVFYCSIHFGKPLGECISSFFGGMLLGAVTLYTRSIWGGLLVHLGIAWLMELGGTIGHQLRPELFY